MPRHSAEHGSAQEVIHRLREGAELLRERVQQRGLGVARKRGEDVGDVEDPRLDSIRCLNRAECWGLRVQRRLLRREERRHVGSHRAKVHHVGFRRRNAAGHASRHAPARGVVAPEHELKVDVLIAARVLVEVVEVLEKHSQALREMGSRDATSQGPGREGGIEDGVVA